MATISLRFALTLTLAFPLMLIGGSAASAEGEGVPLFNGKDLEGWVQPAEGSGGKFVVKDGVIVGTTDGMLKKNEFLVTNKPYRDYVLKVKIKLTNGNSGVQFRSKRTDEGVVSGPQADVADGYWGLLYEERGRGILDKASVDKAKSLLKKDDFNEYVITVKGKHLTIDFNGEQIIDREDPKFADEGIIALQVHVGPPMEVQFKDIMIQELK